MKLETAAQHCAVAGIAGTDAYGQDQRIRLQVTNPYRVKPFIVDVEGREETADGHSDIGIGDEIELGVVHALLDLTVEPMAGDLRQVRLKVAPCLDEPSLPER